MSAPPPPAPSDAVAEGALDAGGELEVVPLLPEQAATSSRRPAAATEVVFMAPTLHLLRPVRRLDGGPRTRPRGAGASRAAAPRRRGAAAGAPPAAGRRR